MMVREVYFKEFFHYPNATVFDSSTTDPLITSSADNWVVTYNATNGGYITSPATPGADLFLTNYANATVNGSFVVYDFHMSFTTLANAGGGLIFGANHNATMFTTACRLRQRADKVLIDTYATGAWSLNASISCNATSATDYYYRVIVMSTDYSIYGSTISNSQGVHIYRGTSYDVLDYVGKVTLPSYPVTGRGGPYVGSGSTIVCDNFGIYSFWRTDVASVAVSHDINEASVMTAVMSRNPDQLQNTFAPSSRVECWVSEDDMDTGANRSRLYFDGKMDLNPNTFVESYVFTGHLKELERIHWQNGSTYNGTNLSDTLKTKLATKGGTNQYSATPGSTYVLHSLNVNATSQEVNTDIQGKPALNSFKHLMLEGDYWCFAYPDGRFAVRKKLIDESITIDTRSQYVRMLEPDIFYDLTQTVSVVDSYYDGWTAPVNSTSSTSLTSFGVRSGLQVDMLNKGLTQAGYRNAAILRRFGGNPEIVKLKMIKQYFNVLPGKKIGLILAGSPCGTNSYDTDTNNWATYAMTCTSTKYDSGTGIHEIVLVSNDQAAGDDPIMRNLPGTGGKSASKQIHLAAMDT